MRKIVVVLLAGLLSLAAFAQRPDWSGQSYNVQRAMESIDGGDFAAAKESLLKEISENDKNGYAYLLLAMIDSRADNYGEALTSADKAIRNLPKRDRQTRAIAYYKRAGIYYSIGDYDRALEDFGKARYMDANGDLSVGTVINLRKVTFAGLELENVRASVVDSNNAPLLLGQSVLARLGKVEIDYEKGVLRITGKERVE